MAILQHTALTTWIAVMVGAAAGASIRFAFGLYLNLPDKPAYGNLAANWLGCLFAGMVLGISMHTKLPDSLKHGISVGFLGGLTTFSAFSGELTTHLLQERWTHAWLILLLHTIGGIICTTTGFALVQLWRRWLI